MNPTTLSTLAKALAGQLMDELTRNEDPLLKKGQTSEERITMGAELLCRSIQILAFTFCERESLPVDAHLNGIAGALGRSIGAVAMPEHIELALGEVYGVVADEARTVSGVVAKSHFSGQKH